MAATDGVDGTSGSAGARVNGGTWQSMIDAGLQPQRALEQCDSATVLDAVDASLTVGPTGTNFADIVVAVLGDYIKP